MGLKPRSRPPAHVRHAWSDGWMLRAVEMCGAAGGDVRAILATADYVNHAIPTYEELAEGVARLQQSGLVETRAGRHAITAEVEARVRQHGVAGNLRSDAYDAVLRLERDATGRPLPPTRVPEPLPISYDEYRTALDAYLSR